MRIFTYFLEAFQFAFHIEVILLDLVEKARGLLARKRRGFRSDGVEQDLALQLDILVIGEFEHDVRKTVAVEILVAPQPLEPRDVAVGDEVHGAILVPLRKIVVVLHHHQHVVAFDLLLGERHVAADTFVITVGALVRAGDDDGFVAAVLGVAILQFVEKLPAFDRLDVGIVRFEVRNLVDAVFEHAAHQRGVEQNARLGLLTHDLVHRTVLHVAEAGQHRRVERRAAIGPHGRQLGAVADQNQTARAAAADILHEVLQQRSGTEQRPVVRTVRQHRSLVHDENGPLFGVDVERIFRFIIGVGPLTVNPLVDGKCLFLSVLGQHLGGPARRSQQNGFDIQILKRTNQRRDQSRFARTRIPVQHKNPGKIVVCEIFGQLFYNFFLPRSCFKTNFSVNLGRNTCAKHASVLFCAKLQTNIRLA